MLTDPPSFGNAGAAGASRDRLANGMLPAVIDQAQMDSRGRRRLKLRVFSREGRLGHASQRKGVEIFVALLTDPVAVTILIIALGLLLGRLNARGLSLGSSGVLFVALAFGCCSPVDPEPIHALGNFGVVLFVYAIGLQAGGRFVHMLRSKGWMPLAVALGTVTMGAATAGLAGTLLGMPPEIAVGVFAGALTSTPALAAATEVANSPLVAVAYGVAYPIGAIAVVLFAQFMPRGLRSSNRLDDEYEASATAESIQQRCFLVQNPGCVGKRISDLCLHEMVTANISRVMRGDEILSSGGDVRLERDDIVLAVGTSKQLDRLALLIGPPVPAEIELREMPNVVARDIHLTEHAFAGRRLRDLRVRTAFGVVITRVRRESFEFVPHGGFVLEIGDQIRAVGYEPDVQRFAEAAGVNEQRLHETGILAFAVGLLLGLLIGLTPLPIPGIGTVKLGLAGGPLFSGLLFGHFGRIGRVRVYVPMAARYLMRELGLVLFLVSAGVGAGAQLLPTLRTQGVALLLLGTVSVTAATATGFALSFFGFRQSVASALGVTCGAMTSTPGLGAASAQFESDTPTLAYATVYPIALVAMTVAAQVMLVLLR